MIYLKLMGRIGNQLFMYAYARKLQKERGDKDTIIIDDSDNHNPEGADLYYENSLINYQLENVKFVHDKSFYNSFKMLPIRFIIKIMHIISRKKNHRSLHDFQVKFQRFFNLFGIYCLQDGYENLSVKGDNIYLFGYFQSEKFFLGVEDELKTKFSLSEELEYINYPCLDIITKRNTVCISIKVQHNVGNIMYDVCSRDYYANAIEYILRHVSNPLFFVCSDNVEYVKANLIDTTKYDVVFQSYDLPVHVQLAVMAKCKHYIIGNSSYAWWAQYLSCFPKKIVIAPKKWYGIDVPCDIYQDNWIYIN